METHLSVINELSNADGVNGNGIQQTWAWSSNALGGEMIWYNAKTVTWEIVNPFSIDGN